MLADGSYGLDCPTQEAFIVIGDHDQIASVKRTISLHPLMMKDKPSVTGRGDEDEQGGRRPYEEESITASYPWERDDGWMEVELGEFYNHQGDTRMVIVKLEEHVQLHWKKGLILEGIEIRPKK